MADADPLPRNLLSCRLLHHGAAATSSSKAVICIPSSEDNRKNSSEIVYASHAVLNVAHCVSAKVGQESTTTSHTQEEPVWTVHQTLRTNSQGSAHANTTVSTYTAKRVISSIALLQNKDDNDNDNPTTLVCGFTDGTISIWRRLRTDDFNWTEDILVQADDETYWDGRSITDIAGMYESSKAGGQACIVTCSSGGVVQYRVKLNELSGNNSRHGMKRTQLLTTPANAVRFHSLSEDATLLLIGTAAPRHNKIHVFCIYANDLDDPSSLHFTTHYSGAMSGHEDWITCLDWRRSSLSSTPSNVASVDHLASGSQDQRIRLWKFTTLYNSTASVKQEVVPELQTFTEKEGAAVDDDDDDDNDDEDGAKEDDEEELEEGESRLEIIVPGRSETSVTLEALLIGHEERVTSVAWHPNPQPIYGEDLILISSSMDRSIFIWSEVSGIWAPISRVGSAGGILGGSIGSSLLGFLNILLEPNDGSWMLGHAYGGALHFFSCQQRAEVTPEMTVEERAALAPWKAQPCLTGHFDNVTDLCWESTFGNYLLTVGNDQTCRAWLPLPINNCDSSSSEQQVWVEFARPQVHGYDLSAITSLSTHDHRHLIVSGADEKELRVFDATRSFDRRLKYLCPEVASASEMDSTQRVEHAYIPSLGLSNLASASEGAEQDTGGVSESNTQLPLERDLGAMSLWPEVLKMYGHNTELTRLTSTVSSLPPGSKGISSEEILVASSAKARDVEAACIRLWNVQGNRCVQVLKGGHRSTVTALAFSPDSNYLVSSGKDRRLCVWERETDGSSTFEFALSCAVDTAHKRIIWGAHFCPLNSNVFATCSRDGTIKVWNLTKDAERKAAITESIVFSPNTLGVNGKPEAVTSLAFAPQKFGDGASRDALLLALGLENGVIEFWKIDPSPEAASAESACVLPPEMCHIAAVTKLAWRPLTSSMELTLASASMDHGCRIFNVSI